MSIHNIPLSIQKRESPLIIRNMKMSAALGFSPRLKNEFEIAMVSEPSVYELLEFYCSCSSDLKAEFTHYKHNDATDILYHNQAWYIYWYSTLVPSFQ